MVVLYFKTSYCYEKENNEHDIACCNSRHNIYQLCRKARSAETTATTTCAGRTATIKGKAFSL